MLEDRDYMQADSYGGPWYRRMPISLWLVIINVLVYAVQLILQGVAASSGRHSFVLETYFALQPASILHGWIWQLLTFQFLHAGPLHLILNSAMLYIFGRSVEATLGRASFLKLYFISGAFGGLLQVGLSLIFRQHFGFNGETWPPTVGASAGIFGLIAAFAIMNRETPITMLLAFFIPVTMKAKYLLVVELVMTVLGLLDSSSTIAHGAHLGGMLMGAFYVTQIIHWHWPGLNRPPRRSPRELVNAGPAKPRSWRRPTVAEAEPLSHDEFLSKQVDPILEKISAHGIHSLTDKERKILESARNKMTGR